MIIIHIREILSGRPMSTPSPNLEQRVYLLEAQVKILRVELQQLRDQLRRPPTAKAIVAAEREAAYEELERTLEAIYDLSPGPNYELTPTQIVADLERSGLQMRTYGATDHARKVVLGRILRRMGVQPEVGSEGGRSYPIARRRQD
jgi:hypothetical protein